VWPVPTQAPLDQQLPVNVVRWVDSTAVSGQDSIGVHSLLFRLGVEMFDLGGGGRAREPRRDRLVHNCHGFQRSVADSVQAFESEVVEDHTHDLVLQRSAVESPPAAGVTIATGARLGHVHSVTLSSSDLRQLARGDRLTVLSTSAPPGSHAHRFELVDAGGLWGAPAALHTDARWPLPPDPGLNPLRSRPNVEIYNDTQMLESPHLPLRPPPDLWLPLYRYRSGVSANDTGLQWPTTADGSPAVILRKSAANEEHYSRALCGFEPWLLRFDSHLGLADFILLRHLRVGLASAAP
jgi:hypothetical protein